MLLKNTTNHRLQGHSVYVIRNIKFSDNVRHRKNVCYRDVVFDPIYSFICYKYSPIAAVVWRSRVKYKYSYFLCDSIVILSTRVQII